MATMAMLGLWFRIFFFQKSPTKTKRSFLWREKVIEVPKSAKVVGSWSAGQQRRATAWSTASKLVSEICRYVKKASFLHISRGYAHGVVPLQNIGKLKRFKFEIKHLEVQVLLLLRRSTHTCLIATRIVEFFVKNCIEWTRMKQIHVKKWWTSMWLGQQHYKDTANTAYNKPPAIYIAALRYFEILWTCLCCGCGLFFFLMHRDLGPADREFFNVFFLSLHHTIIALCTVPRSNVSQLHMWYFWSILSRWLYTAWSKAKLWQENDNNQSLYLLFWIKLCASAYWGRHAKNQR